MREDCYAAYACGHIEFDISTLNVGETSYCNECQQSQVIVARKPTNGPRQPLDEKDAEIAHLRHQIKVKDAALHIAQEWVSRFGEHAPITFGGESELNGVLQIALDCK